MIKQFLYVLVMSIVCMAEVDAMYAIVKRLHAPSPRTFGRTVVTSKLFDQVKAVGLKQCMEAYKNEKCRNSLCCRDVFFINQTIETQKNNDKKKVSFLEKIDKTEGKLSFLYKIQYAYNELSRIEKLAIDDCDADELIGFISQQKRCLQNQLKVIQERDGDIAFINNEDQCIIDKKFLESEAEEYRFLYGCESQECKYAYKTGKCCNETCCKDIFKTYSLGEIMGWRDPDIGDPTIYQIIQSDYIEIRKKLLNAVDKRGHLNFLLDIQKKYDALCAAKKIVLFGIKEDKTLEEVLKTIIHQKFCLQKQIFVLYTENPNIIAWRDGFHDSGKIATLYFPSTDDYVEKIILSLRKKMLISNCKE